VSLAALTEGEHVTVDPSVALLAPLVLFSGLDAASVLRFAGPIFAVVMMLILMHCLTAAWRSPKALVVTMALSVLFFALAPAIATEWSGTLASGVYWLSAAALWHTARRDALLAALLGIMICPTEWIWPCAAVTLIALFWVSARRFDPRWKLLPAASTLLACVVTFGTFPIATAQAPRITQYESAARICARIGHDFHPKEWIIVSPFQELAFSYGRGWHVELSEFVTRFTLDQMSDPAFVLPYDCPHVFFFVERRPLAQGTPANLSKVSWRYSPAESSDWSAFLYSDPVGRSSLEYRAAELLNTYTLHHSTLSIYYEDDDLLVYDFARSAGRT
jgi:hypothetical protein